MTWATRRFRSAYPWRSNVHFRMPRAIVGRGDWFCAAHFSDAHTASATRRNRCRPGSEICANLCHLCPTPPLGESPLGGRVRTQMAQILTDLPPPRRSRCSRRRGHTTSRQSPRAADHLGCGDAALRPSVFCNRAVSGVVFTHAPSSSSRGREASHVKTGDGTALPYGRLLLEQPVPS